MRACLCTGVAGLSDITQLLQDSTAGSPNSLEQVFARLYPELRSLAQARLGNANNTLTPTVLVNEAFLKLTDGASLNLQCKRHFFACAARAMRQILVDHVRQRNALKRGGDQIRVTLDESAGNEPPLATEVLALDRALDELNERNPQQAEVVNLHYFAGLTFAEVAEMMDCSERTTKRQWSRARAFLHTSIQGCES